MIDLYFNVLIWFCKLVLFDETVVDRDVILFAFVVIWLCRFVLLLETVDDKDDTVALVDDKLDDKLFICVCTLLLIVFNYPYIVFGNPCRFPDTLILFAKEVVNVPLLYVCPVVLVCKFDTCVWIFELIVERYP